MRHVGSSRFWVADGAQIKLGDTKQTDKALLFKIVGGGKLMAVSGQHTGLLVGVGTRLGGGCTSGHGVCGIGRLSMRSLAATVIFMVAAVLTVFIVRHVVGG